MLSQVWFSRWLLVPLNVMSLKVKATGEPSADVRGIILSEQFWSRLLR